DAGYGFVLVSNQDGRGTTSFPEASFREPHEFLMRLLASQGIRFEAEFICPHFERDGCDCRKPKLGLLRDYLRDTPLDRANSFVIGDRDTDIELARNIGIEGLRIDGSPEGTWAAIAD